MPNTQTRNAEISYVNPGSADWLPLSEGIEGLSPEKIKENKKRLEEVLLSSLRMQNICVLAGCGTSFGKALGPSMKDLWQLCMIEPGTDQEYKTSILPTAKKIGFSLDTESPNIELFLSKCEAYLQIKNNASISAIIKNCKEVILGRCSQTSGDLQGHKTFLQRLSRRRSRDSRLKVFTTNYDTCFERAASELGLVVLDGFSFSQPRRYDPRYFSYDIVRRTNDINDVGSYLEGVIQLYKLHGSVNWCRMISDLPGNTLETIYQVESPDPDKVCLIYPAKGKYQQTYIQPHLELFAQYLSALREPNTCFIISGFGFNDDHIAEPLLSAIQSNPNLRVIVCDPFAKSKIEDVDQVNKYWNKLSDISAHGGDVYFINADFEDFSYFIPDLHALSGAEKLASAVRGVAGSSHE